MTPEQIIALISGIKFNLKKEKTTQEQLFKVLKEKGCNVTRHLRFDDENIPDFFIPDTGLVIEVKIKGQIRAIYKQCVRYCEFDQVKCLILVSSHRMGFPPHINGKPCYFVNISKAYL